MSLFYNSRTFLSAYITLIGIIAVLTQETHTVTYTNNCGKGHPVFGGLHGQFYPDGNSLVFSGPAWGLISYLQYTDENGNYVCGENGEGCTMIEASLSNTGSSADITLVYPHVFSVSSAFKYYNGCDGAGAECTSADCALAKHNSSQSELQVGCSVSNVSIAIAFCNETAVDSPGKDQR